MTMKYRHLGKSGLRVSELCLGTMTFGTSTEEKESLRIVDHFIDSGGNFIDTANIYGIGKSEIIVGKSLNKRRDKIVLATKVRATVGPGPNDYGLSRKHILYQIEESLRRLQTDYIDLYQMHIWDYSTPIEETLSVFTDLVHQGKIRYIGISNFTAWQIMKAVQIIERYGFEMIVSLQAQYNLLIRDIEREILPACIEVGIGIIPWSPLAGGFLTGKYKKERKLPKNGRFSSSTWKDVYKERYDYPDKFRIVELVEKIANYHNVTASEVALKWLLMKPGIISVDFGARRYEHLINNIGAIDLEISTDEIKTLNEASKLQRGYPYEMIEKYHSNDTKWRSA
jgi:aryl-alcohol dehydrogenase-like predicted oxidoreductase